MALRLVRIDERLIHGQVLVGWGGRLSLDVYVIADDELAASDWEQELWASALAGEGRVEFLTVAAAAERVRELDAGAERAALLTRDTAAMRALAERGCLDGRSVNVGGVHAAPGRRKVLEYVHLSRREAEDLRAIGRRCAVSARDVPNARRVPLEALRVG